MNYTLALDVHAELQQQCANKKFANGHEAEYEKELLAELGRTFGGTWEIGNADELPEEADYESLNDVFARAAEKIMK